MMPNKFAAGTVAADGCPEIAVGSTNKRYSHHPETPITLGQQCMNGVEITGAAAAARHDVY